MQIFSFRSKKPQLDLTDENDPSVPLGKDGPNDGGFKRFWGLGRPSSASLAKPPPANRMLFFGICDMRIATVMLNVMHIIFTFLLEVVDTAKWSEEELPVLALVAFVCSVIGILGALNFSTLAMSVSTLGFIYLFYLYISTMHIFGLAILCFIVFAQLVLMIEMINGIMTKENYGQEEYIVPEGREALQKAHSYASDVAETSKVVALEVRQSSAILFAPDNILGPEKPKTAEC